MNHLQARFSPPRIDVFNAAENRVSIALPGFSASVQLDGGWLYAKLVPLVTAPVFSINPVTHVLTGCTGDVDGSKLTMHGMNYLFAAVEVIDLSAPTPLGASNLTVGFTGAPVPDHTLAVLYRDIENQQPAWVELVSPRGGPESFMGGPELLTFDSGDPDTNMRVHLLMGCFA